MYKVFRNTRLASKQTFFSYNEAKAFARRKATTIRGYYWDGYSDVGLKIVAV